jgi:hypothetical protein
MSVTKANGAEEAIKEFRSLGGPFGYLKAGMGVNSIRAYSASIRLFNLLYPNAREMLPVGERRKVGKLNMKEKENDE